MPEQPGAAIDCCKRHRMGIAKVEPFAPLGDDDRRMAVGRKIEIVGVVDRDGWPGLPVLGSIGVKLPDVRRLPLLATHKVFKSHDGTTCCGLTPTGKRSITARVAGSIT